MDLRSLSLEDLMDMHEVLDIKEHIEEMHREALKNG